MKRKISIWTAIILSGSMMMGAWQPMNGFTNSAVHAAAEFGITVSPAVGANYVNTGANLRLSFDRQVSPQNGEITIIASDSKAEFVKIATGSYGVVGSSNAYDIKWGADKKFQPNTKYTASVPQGLFKDSEGNVSAAASWSFLTAPENDPAITASEFSPAANSRVDAAGVTQLSFKLNKKLLKGGGTIRLMSSFSNDTVQEYQISEGASGVDVQSDAVSTTVKLAVATGKLAAGSNYYILIDAYAFKAEDNRTFAGISSGSVWSFSTVGGEAKNVTTVPEKGAVNVPTTEVFRLSFDRPMMPAAGYITVSPNTADGSGTRWVNVNSTSVVGGGEKTITFTPASNDSPLLSGTTYTVTIPQGAFYDRDGNVFPASGPYTWTFTTTPLSGLAVSALSPADRSESVAVSKAMTITFNRDAVYNNIDGGVVLYKSNGSSTKIPVTVENGSSSKEFIIRPATALEPASTYYVDIAKGVFTDANTAGLMYDGISGRSSWSFQTNVLDNTSPVLTSAQLDNNRTIRLKYNETLNAGVALLYSSFAVTVNDEKRTIDSVFVQGDSVYITLSTGVAVGQIVKISYSGGLRTIQDSSGNAAGTFTSQQVTNAIQSALPAPRDGVLSGTTVTLNFNDTLKAVSANAYSQFYVYADGGSLGVNSITSSGNSIVLGLNNAAPNGQTVRVTYYAGSYPLQDSYSQNIANFSDFYIRNTSDSVAPVFQNAVGAEKKVVLTYNEGISTAALPLNSQFSVLVGSTANYVTGVAVSGNQVTLTLQNALTVNQYTTVSYVPGSAGLTDLNGNRAAYLNLQPVAVTGSTGTSVPDISSAVISGDEITVTFSKNMQTSTAALYVNQFGVRVDGSSVGVQSYYVSGNVLKLTLSTIVKTGQVVDLSYMAGSGAITDASGIPLPSFTALSVYNGTGTSSATASRPAYLGTLAASEFGQEYPLLKSDSAAAADDRSVYSQSVKRYTLTADRLTASYDYLSKLGSSVLAFEVPSTEPAAYVVLPLKPLLNAVNRDKKATIVIRYGDNLYTLPLNNVDMNSLAASLVADSSNISLIIRMEKVPAGTFTPFEQKLGTQGLKGITGLTDIRLTAAISSNFTSASALSVSAEYAARTTSTLNNDQTSAARLDLAYYDAVYLPTKISTTGSYTVIRAATTGNQVVGTFLSTRTFSDMSKHWSNSVVSLLAAKNIIDSSYGSTFKPEQKITRAEFAVMLSRGLGLLGDRETAQRFRDVQPSTQTGDYIGAAAKAGIITGNTDATFRPDDNITREQLAIMIIRAMEYSGNPITLSGTSASALSIFKDKAKIQNLSAEFVAKAVQEGIILGMTPTEFQPQGNATRAQAAVMLQRMLSMAGYL
ncbi:Ig-like domain-containing protein [Paenibacillus sp. MMS20-IR301]|uniref:Ig-like domain-containing protein n=1 Tax=Paenibacillus sp. MMS20-IR301 TaxID=2895946 RepID=UPI0028E5F880|nr:Ig-like domain-containing protein [Paenibacillus sp. MMS20-IR301]WNS42653.1 Ig-like domain-containing protein [Paenibacillus sp. MMS20-IR301]